MTQYNRWWCGFCRTQYFEEGLQDGLRPLTDVEMRAAPGASFRCQDTDVCALRTYQRLVTAERRHRRHSAWCTLPAKRETRKIHAPSPVIQQKFQEHILERCSDMGVGKTEGKKLTDYSLDFYGIPYISDGEVKVALPYEDGED